MSDEVERLKQLLRDEADEWRRVSFAFRDDRRLTARRRAQLIEVAIGERDASDVIPEAMSDQHSIEQKIKRKRRTLASTIEELSAKGLAPCPLCGMLVGLDNAGRINVHGRFGESCSKGGKMP